MEEYIGLIVAVGCVIAVLLIFFSIFKSRKNTLGFPGKMMENLLDQQQKMLENNSDKLGELVNTALKTKKKILEDNAEDLEYITKKEAEINSSGVRVTAQAVKEGLTDNVKDNNKIYCKHCGSRIDSDSIFCKHCGKEQ